MGEHTCPDPNRGRRAHRHAPAGTAVAAVVGLMVVAGAAVASAAEAANGFAAVCFVGAVAMFTADRPDGPGDGR